MCSCWTKQGTNSPCQWRRTRSHSATTPSTTEGGRRLQATHCRDGVTAAGPHDGAAMQAAKPHSARSPSTHTHTHRETGKELAQRQWRRRDLPTSPPHLGQAHTAQELAGAANRWIAKRGLLPTTWRTARLTMPPKGSAKRQVRRQRPSGAQSFDIEATASALLCP